jgi:hypothetical protein
MGSKEENVTLLLPGTLAAGVFIGRGRLSFMFLATACTYEFGIVPAIPLAPLLVHSLSRIGLRHLYIEAPIQVSAHEGYPTEVSHNIAAKMKRYGSRGSQNS